MSAWLAGLLGFLVGGGMMAALTIYILAWVGDHKLSEFDEKFWSKQRKGDHSTPSPAAPGRTETRDG